MTIFSAAMLLFLVMDPMGNIPFFLTALEKVQPQRRKLIIFRELCIALIVLVTFLLGGQYILNILQISEPSLTVSGGIILFLIALRMIFPGKQNGGGADIEGEPFIVPLAIPFVAGPSAMASVMLIMSSDTSRWMEWLGALLLAWALTGVILFAATSLSRHLGRRGLIAIERLMGMVLTTIAVQMIMDGVRKFMLAG